MALYQHGSHNLSPRVEGRNFWLHFLHTRLNFGVYRIWNTAILSFEPLFPVEKYISYRGNTLFHTIGKVMELLYRVKFYVTPNFPCFPPPFPLCMTFYNNNKLFLPHSKTPTSQPISASRNLDNKPCVSLN